MTSSRSSSARRPRIIASPLPRRLDDAAHGTNQRLPPARFDIELSATFGRQSIELGAAVIFGGAVIERNPAPLDEPMQRGVQRPLLHLQHVVGTSLDAFHDRMAMGRSQ